MIPILLNLKNRLCVIVGGGAVACRRIEQLLSEGAIVRVVSPAINDEIECLFTADKLEWIKSEYAPEYLAGAYMIIAAADNPDVNTKAVLDGDGMGLLTCNASSGQGGAFIFPSFFQQGDLIISVSTLGASPSLASRICHEIELEYGPEYAPYTMLLAEVREVVIQETTDPHQRKKVLNELAQDREILDLIRSGRIEEARAKAFSCISH
jgi:precorrin-2 dehydrogenase/sirohydrochlorin ferrochelatase